jgi:hypothetical protein
VSGPDISKDDELLEALSAALDALDPVPDEALQAAAGAWEICNIDAELAPLVATSQPVPDLALMRDEADLRSMSFVASKLTVDIEINSDRHIIGVISPPAARIIEVESASATRPALGRTVRSDDLGRFRLDLEVGLCRLRIGTGPDAVLTAWFYC